MIQQLFVLLVGSGFAGAAVQAPPADSTRHPLDGLTAAEYAAVPATLTRQGRVEEFAALFPLITLEEPPKDVVRGWRAGDSISRRAFAIVMVDGRVFEAVVDVARDSVVSWERVEGVEPGILLSAESSFASRIVLANEEFREALARRAITSPRDVVCIPFTVGSHGQAEEAGRRLVKVVCYLGRDTDNFWGRPIEGLIGLVDLRAGEVIRVLDTGPRIIPSGPVDFDLSSVGAPREPPRPIAIVQPEGASFALNGQLVRWQKWQFHFRVDPRLGLVVSTVGYNEEGRLRSILYQGALSELFVPYMDPDEAWYFRTFMDAGEYGVGKLAVELVPGRDCPDNAVYFDAVFADDWGEPYTQPRAACLFERYAGDVAWRHSEAMTGKTEVRKRVDLVLRSVSAIGNYDYVFDWVFRQDGAMRVSVGSTGVPVVKAVHAERVSSDSGTDGAFGRMLAPRTVAVNHDHFFAFRLDLDVDGHRNSFVTERLTGIATSGSTPRTSVWVVDSRIAATEGEAKVRIDLERPALWRAVNPDVEGPVGYPVSYQLVPEVNAVSLLAKTDPPQRRAGFTDFHLWVTPHQPRERYAAGDYPNQHEGGDGLPRWTAANRAIENTDIVLWYTMGFHHVVRAEDWPVMPTAWGGFELRPFDFFPRNPSLDLPR